MKKINSLFCSIVSSIAFIHSDFQILEYPASTFRMRKQKHGHVQIIESAPIKLNPKKDTFFKSTAQPTQKVIAKKDSREPQPEKQSPSEKINTKTAQSTSLILEKQTPQLKKDIDILNAKPFITEPSGTLHTKNNMQQTLTITACSTITQEMITYHHWSGSYTPEFTIAINETIISLDNEVVISSTQGPFKIEYKAVFPYGYSSADSIEYQPHESIKKIILGFDWHRSPRIIITEATN